MEDESEYLKLPAEDRCVHKLWKARVSGYEEAIQTFSKWDGDDPNWKKVRCVDNSEHVHFAFVFLLCRFFDQNPLSNHLQ